MKALNASEADLSTTQLVPKTSNIRDSFEKSSMKSHLSVWHRYQDSWYPELTALSLSVLCVIAIAIILKSYDGEANPKMKWGLTLNAVISILATTSKVALIFTISNSIGQLKWVWFLGQDSRCLSDASVYDDASRGPLGSLLMLCTGTRKSVASVGAVLILLALTYDPFVQQIISFEATPRVQPTNSSDVVINTANSFRVGEDTLGTTDIMRRAINAAYWTDSDFTLMPSCPRGNCEWPAFETLAWHAKCYEDKNWTLSDDCNLQITNEQFSNLPIDEEQNLNCSIVGPLHNYHLAPKTRLLHLNASYVRRMGTSFGQGQSDANGKESFFLEYSGTNLTIIPTYDIFSSFDAIAQNTSNPEWGTSKVSGPIWMLGLFGLARQEDLSTVLMVTTCELDLLLDTYQVESSDNDSSFKLPASTELLKSFTEEPGDTLYDRIYMLDLSPSTSSENGILPDTLYIHNLSLEDSPAYHVYPLGGQYWAVQNWVNALRDKFPLVMRTEMITEAIELSNDSSKTRTNHYIFQSAPYIADDEVYVWAEEGPEYIMNNLAASMNKLMLDPTQNRNGTVPVYGRASVPITLVKVTWPWVVLPFGLCLATIVFFLTTVYLSHVTGAPLWKSSINAFFYHGIDFDSGIWTPLTTIPEMDAQAAGTQAKLAPVGIFQRLMLETCAAKN